MFWSYSPSTGVKFVLYAFLINAIVDKYIKTNMMKAVKIVCCRVWNEKHIFKNDNKCTKNLQNNSHELILSSNLAYYHKLK